MMIACNKKTTWLFDEECMLAFARYDESFIWDVRTIITFNPLKRLLLMRNRATGFALLLDVTEPLVYSAPQFLALMKQAMVKAGLSKRDVGAYLKEGEDVRLMIDQTPTYAKRKVAELAKWVESVDSEEAMKTIAERPAFLNRRHVDPRALMASQIAEEKDEIIKVLFPTLIVRIELRLPPPHRVWRRFLLPATLTFGDLHEVIQTGFGWEDRHLHEFRLIGGVRVIPGDEIEEATHWYDDDTRFIDEDEVLIGEVMGPVVYRYDFGDEWIHSIVVEGMSLVDEHPPAPLCLEGVGNRPWEDCGGPYGYEDTLAILADPSDPDHQWMQSWTREMSEGTVFDLADVNASLQELFIGVQPAIEKAELGLN